MKKVRQFIFLGGLLIFISQSLYSQGVEVRYLGETDQLLKNGYFGFAITSKPIIVNKYLVDSLRLKYEIEIANCDIKEDQPQLLKPVPAFKIPVKISTEDQKNIFRVSGGTVKKQTIILKGAKGITISFGEINLSKGSKMIIYSLSKRFLIGPINGDRFQSVKKYIADIIPGEEVNIELFTPYGSDENNYLITSLSFHTEHDYPYILNDSLVKTSGSGGWDPCYVNSVCPLGEPFVNQRDAVVRIKALFFPGDPNVAYWGSGVLIGNTANNNEPYILTARHVVDIDNDGIISSEEEGLLSSMKFLFFDEHWQCSHPYLPPSPSTKKTFQGALLIAENPNTDMVLLKINDALDDIDTRFYFAGWKANSHIPNELYSLGHPEGLSMMISKSDDPGTNSLQFQEDGVTIPAQYAYKVKWDEGCTASGSSGGPFFNSYGYIVGTYTGGKSFLGIKRFLGGRISHAWSVFGQFLDPVNNGSTVGHNGRRAHSITGPDLICDPGSYQFEYHYIDIDTNDISWSVPAFGVSGSGPIASFQVSGNEEPGREQVVFSFPRQNGGDITLTKYFIHSGRDLAPYTSISIFDKDDIPVPLEPEDYFKLELDEEYRLYAATNAGSAFYAPVTNWNWNIPFDWELLSLDPSHSEIRIKTPSEPSPLKLQLEDYFTVDVYDNYCQVWNYGAAWAPYELFAPIEGFVFAFSPNPIKNVMRIKRISKEMAATEPWIIMEATNSGMKIQEDEFLVRILNERGVVYEKRYSLNEFSIELGSLPKGVYFIHIFSGNEVFRGKFIKERY